MKKILLKLVLPVLIIVLAYFQNPLLGLALAAAYVGYLLYSGRSSIFAFLGSMNYSKGKMDEAINWFQKAYQSGKAKSRTITSYGYLLLKSGKVEEAEKVLATVVASKLVLEDLMFAKSNMALVQWKKGNLDEAISILEGVLTEYKTTTVYGSLGYLLIEKGDLEKALAVNLEAYEYNSSNSIILDNLGNTYYFLKEYDKAIEIYEKVMKLNPTFPEAYFNYGQVLAATQQREKALELMKKSLEYRISTLSTTTREKIEARINELEHEEG